MSNSLLLSQAKTALHNLATGRMAAVVVDQNGERIEYSKTNIADLRAYIAYLETGGGTPVTRPLAFLF